MEDTNNLEVELRIRDSSKGPTTGVVVMVVNDDGINLEQVEQELRTMLVNWAMDWLKYLATTKVVILPRSGWVD